MNALVTTAAPIALIPADSQWSVLNLLENTRSFGALVGGSLIMLMGLVAVVYGVVKLLMKFMSDKDQGSWFKIIAMILVGGAFLVGGFNLAFSLAEGGKQTIDDLGNGLILFLGM